MIALIFLVVPVGNCAVNGDHEVLAGLVAGLFHCGDKCLECVLVGIEVGSVAALIADAGSRNDLLEGVEHLCTHTQCFLPAGCADRHDHELLNVNIRTGCVCAAVEDIHHGARQSLGVYAADVVIKALTGDLCRCTGTSKGYAEDGVCAETGLVGSAVYLDEHFVDAGLVKDIQSYHCFGNLSVYVFNSLGDALAEVTVLVTVTQFAGLIHTGGCTGGDCCTAYGAVIKGDLNLNGGIAS